MGAMGPRIQSTNLSVSGIDELHGSIVNTRSEFRKNSRRLSKRINGRNPWIWIALGLIVLVVMLLLWFLLSVGEVQEDGYPQVGDHWHADYTIYICGALELDYPYSEGGIHTHGEGRLHIHPSHSGEAGSNATMARFFAGTGGRLTDTMIETAGGQVFNNGDTCPDGNVGNILLKVNGISERAIASYVPRDNDILELRFE